VAELDKKDRGGGLNVTKIGGEAGLKLGKCGGALKNDDLRAKSKQRAK
jgi:hypothetical protein